MKKSTFPNQETSESVFIVRSLSLVQIVATAVCHTDLYLLFENMHKDAFPTVLGHEAAGIVESVGPGVTEYQPGQFCIVQHLRVHSFFCYLSDSKLMRFI